MNQQEILIKAIEKAGLGWLEGKGYNGYTVWTPANTLDTSIILEEKESHKKRQYNYQAIIFNHDFAKALWGEDTNRLWKCPACGYSFEYYKHNETQEYCPSDGRKVKDVTEPKPVWEQKWADRLQEMVIADDPLDYLKENI